MKELIEVPGFGEIMRNNVVQAIESMFLISADFLNHDYYILVSVNTKSLCNLAYLDKDLNITIYAHIRICDRLKNNEAELIKIVDFEKKPLLIAKLVN